MRVAVQPGPLARPNASVDGSVTISAPAAAPMSTRPFPCAAAGAPGRRSAVPVERAPELVRRQPGPRLRDDRGLPGRDRGGGARAVHEHEVRRVVRRRAGVDRDDADTGAGDLGLRVAAEAEPPGRESGDPRVAVRFRSVRTGRPRARGARPRVREQRPRDAEHGDPERRAATERACREAGAAEEDDGGARRGGGDRGMRSDRSRPRAATALSATLLTPPRSKRCAAATMRSDVERRGPTAPSTGTSRFSSTCRPSRTTTRATSVCRRRSAAATVSAAGAPPGPERLPNAGPAGPSFPAGATTSVSERRRARGGAGERVRPRTTPNGSASGTSAMRAASCASPLPSGSTTRSRPGEDLVGPGEERVAAGGVLLPAADADRQHRRAGRDAGDARPPGPDDDARHLRPVPLDDTAGTRPRPRVDRSRRRRPGPVSTWPCR